MSARLAGGSSTAGVLRWAAVAVALVTALVLLPWAYDDSGWFGAVLVGVPVLASLLPVLPGLPRAAVVALTVVACVVVLLWSLLLGLGIGLYFLPTAALLLAAGVVAARPADDR